jgi:hypothetical protein
MIYKKASTAKEKQNKNSMVWKTKKKGRSKNQTKITYWTEREKKSVPRCGSLKKCYKLLKKKNIYKNCYWWERTLLFQLMVHRKYLNITENCKYILNK